MAEEKIVYLGKDEDLTMVRERLQSAQSRRVVLVVPAQTQLRSRTSWKLIFSWAQELGKDVSVISGDKELRSVVRAAGLRVADSNEVTSQNKGRFGRHTGRTNTGAGGKTMSRLKTPPSRGPEPLSGGGRSAPPPSNPSSTFSSHPATFDDQHFHVDDLGPGESIASHPPAGESPSPQFGPGYDLRIGDSGIHPVVSPSEDEDTELMPPGSILASDQERAQSIRQAAREANPSSWGQDVEPPSGSMNVPPPATFGDSDETGTMPEQRGSVPPPHWRHSNPDVTPLPTNVNAAPEIEYLGDSDEILAPPPPSAPYAEWDRQASQQAMPESPLPEPPMIQGRHPRASLAGSMAESQSIEQPEERGARLADEPTAILPNPSRTTGKMPTVPPRAPEPHVLPQPGQLAPRPPSRAGGDADRARASSQVPVRQPGQRRARRRNSTLTGFIIVLFVLALVGLLIYVLPSATVAITLPSQSYPLQMAYTAAAGSRLDTTAHTLPAQTLTFTTTVHGTGRATGSKPVGTVFATGVVTFTNSGTASIHIPFNTVIQTKSNITFETTSDTLVPPGGANNSVSVPVQASQAGSSGNVAANAITVIPSSTLTALQQANPGVTIQLTVNNQQATTGGGTGSVTYIVQHDVGAAQSKLSSQVQQQVQGFIQKNTTHNDAVGKPVLEETPVTTPAVGSEVKSGTFSLVLHVQMHVLVVRAAEIQAVAGQEINQTLKLKKPGYQLAPQQPVRITTLNVPSKSDTSLALKFEAMGTIVPQVAVAQIRSLVSGKQVGAARTALLSKQEGTAAIQNASIQVYPGFIPWVPFWQQRITVTFQSIPATPTPTPTPTKTPKR